MTGRMSDNPRFAGPVGRLKSCIENWPECFSGDYNPSCCRFPKSCSCDAWSDDDPELYEPFHVAEKTAPVSDNPADSLRRELETALRERPPCKHSTRYGKPTRERTDLACAECDVDAIWPLVEAARADERERTKAALRQIHWVTTYASGKFEGLPCCGCCAWLDGVRRPWPCDTLQAVGFTDDDIPAELRAVSDGN